jgi:hypothetical protein
LKEEHFRKQMQSKFTSKLEHLENLLKSWQISEGSPFDQNMMSDEVRGFLRKADRSEFMHLRTTEYKGSSTRKRVSAANATTAVRPARNIEARTDSIANRTRTKRKVQESESSHRPKKIRTPLKVSLDNVVVVDELLQPEKQIPRKRVVLDPFAAVLGDYGIGPTKEN